MERLDKVLSNMGIGSRKEVKALIKRNQVIIDGEIASDAGLQIDPHKCEIQVCGQRLEYKKYIYLMMNKPAGFVSATDDNRYRTVAELVPIELAHYEPFPVGRLDIDTEGLLLMTNDGQLAHKLLSPRNKVDKLYYAELDMPADDDDIRLFEKGVKLDDGYVTMPAKLECLEDSCALVTIHEGKYHQVKRMFNAVGKEVLYLKRLAMGGLRLDENLDYGECRELTDEELRIIGVL